MRVPFLIAAAVAALAACGPQGPSQADIMAGRDGTPEGTPPGQTPLYPSDTSSPGSSGSPDTSSSSNGGAPQGGSASPMPVPYGAAPGGQGPAPAMTPRYGLSVVVTDAGDRKISVIQEVMSIRPDLGLADAKALVESGSGVIKSGVSAAEATDIKARLEAAGARVSIN